MDGMHVMVPAGEYDELCRVDGVFDELRERGAVGEYLMLPVGADERQWTVDCGFFEHGDRAYDTTGFHYSLVYSEWHVSGLTEDGEYEFPMSECRPFKHEPSSMRLREALEEFAYKLGFLPGDCADEIDECLNSITPHCGC